VIFICFSSCHVILTERVSGGRRVWGIGCRREGTREERATNQARDGRRGRQGREESLNDVKDDDDDIANNNQQYSS
jgi:hypothetical protein